MSKTLAYFVNDISTSFVHKDLQLVSKSFEKVLLFSTEPVPERHLVPKHVEIIDEFMDWNRFDMKKTLIRFLPSILSIYLFESLKSRQFLPFKTTLALIASNIFKANELIRHLKHRHIAVTDIQLYYSFWFYDCIYLAWLKRSYSSIKVISRAHGGDLFEDRDSISNRPLLRNFQLTYLNKVYSVSDMGTNYLRKRYANFSDKIQTVFLGTEDYNTLNPFQKNQLIIVSCASIRYMKRIEVIAETISHLKGPVIWYHFGSENLESNEPCIPEYLRWKSILQGMQNVEYKPMGYCSNEDLMQFYKTQPVNLFISLSAAEGIPVSMMEAISFGIPVLSTDVGGCKEIVNEKTGHLIPLSSQAQEIAKWIEEFKDSALNTPEYRASVRSYWQSKFEISANYRLFFEHIK